MLPLFAQLCMSNEKTLFPFRSPCEWLNYTNPSGLPLAWGNTLYTFLNYVFHLKMFFQHHFVWKCFQVPLSVAQAASKKAATPCPWSPACSPLSLSPCFWMKRLLAMDLRSASIWPRLRSALMRGVRHLLACRRPPSSMSKNACTSFAHVSHMVVSMPIPVLFLCCYKVRECRWSKLLILCFNALTKLWLCFPEMSCNKTMMVWVIST